MNSPLVSIVLPSYNHQKFILQAVESILQQTYRHYEIIILDDASSDDSAQVVKAYIAAHPELPIRFYCHDANQGGVITLNHLIEHASGEYIALLNSDDVWLPDKLQKQVDYLNAHPEIGAVFTQATIVGEDQQSISEEKLPAVVQETFLQKNRSRGQWLRRFYFEQNCLCHPSILIRKQVYEQIGLYDPRFRQVPDFQMWTRFLKTHEFHLIEEPLVLLRWHTSNTSVINASNSIRGINELFYLYRDFFNDVPDEVFIDGFADLFRDTAARQPAALACEKAFLYLLPDTHIKSVYHNIGLEKLYRLLGDPLTRQCLAEKYNFTFNDFFALGGQNTFDGRLLYTFVEHTQSAPGSTILPPPPPSPGGLKFLIGEVLIKVPALYKLARVLFRTLTGKGL